MASRLGGFRETSTPNRRGPIPFYVKINKYENPQAALNLISHICTTGVSFDVSKYADKVFSFFEDDWSKRVYDPKDSEKVIIKFKDVDFLYDLKWDCWSHIYDLADDPYDTIDIAVAGGFSSGKSSLLNKIVNLQDLLPTGVEPVSVVNTKIVCDNEISRFSIQGRNLKDENISLNADVLDCIQHSSKSKVFVASVLQSITIYKPVTKEQAIEGITFIDTPGYNNAVSANRENGKTDKETSLNAINSADAVIWCIDIEAGTISEADIQMLQEVDENKPIVIMFTQMDKKSDVEVRTILNKAEKIVSKRLNSLNIIKVIAYSRDKDRSICLRNYHNEKNQINGILKDIKKRCKGTVNFIRDIEKKIDEEIKASEEYSRSLEDDRKLFVTEKNEWYQKVSKDKKIAQLDIDTMDLLKDIWSKYSSEVFNEDYCDEVLGYIDQLRDNLNIYIDYYIDKRETNHSETVDSLKNTIENKNNEEKCLKFLRELKYSLLSLLNTLKLDIRREYFNINRKLVDISTGGRIDIFSAIRLGDYNRFLQCFNDGEGVNIGQTDKDGYTPITFAAKEGNNQMVQFFIDNDIDLSVCDKRGYNAFETAVINHYQDICDLILSKDSSIINLCDKSLDELASMNTFNKWIKMHQK